MFSLFFDGWLFATYMIISVALFNNNNECYENLLSNKERTQQSADGKDSKMTRRKH